MENIIEPATDIKDVTTSYTKMVPIVSNMTKQLVTMMQSYKNTNDYIKAFKSGKMGDYSLEEMKQFENTKKSMYDEAYASSLLLTEELVNKRMQEVMEPYKNITKGNVFSSFATMYSYTHPNNQINLDLKDTKKEIDNVFNDLYYAKNGKLKAVNKKELVDGILNAVEVLGSHKGSVFKYSNNSRNDLKVKHVMNFIDIAVAFAVANGQIEEKDYDAFRFHDYMLGFYAYENSVNKESLDILRKCLNRGMNDTKYNKKNSKTVDKIKIDKVNQEVRFEENTILKIPMVNEYQHTFSVDNFLTPTLDIMGKVTGCPFSPTDAGAKIVEAINKFLDGKEKKSLEKEALKSGVITSDEQKTLKQGTTFLKKLRKAISSKADFEEFVDGLFNKPANYYEVISGMKDSNGNKTFILKDLMTNNLVHYKSKDEIVELKGYSNLTEYNALEDKLIIAKEEQQKRQKEFFNKVNEKATSEKDNEQVEVLVKS